MVTGIFIASICTVGGLLTITSTAPFSLVAPTTDDKPKLSSTLIVIVSLPAFRGVTVTMYSTRAVLVGAGLTVAVAIALVVAVPPSPYLTYELGRRPRPSVVPANPGADLCLELERLGTAVRTGQVQLFRKRRFSGLRRMRSANFGNSSRDGQSRLRVDHRNVDHGVDRSVYSVVSGDGHLRLTRGEALYHVSFVAISGPSIAALLGVFPGSNSTVATVALSDFAVKVSAGVVSVFEILADDEVLFDRRRVHRRAVLHRQGLMGLGASLVSAGSSGVPVGPRGSSGSRGAYLRT